MPRPSWSRTLVGLPTRSWLPAHGARGDAIAALFQLMPLGAGGLAQHSPSSGQTAELVPLLIDDGGGLMLRRGRR